MVKATKRLVLIAAVMLLATALAVPAFAQSTVTVLVGNWNPADFDPIIAEFEAANPNIVVEPIYVNWDETDDKFQVMVASGTAPDVFINNSVFGWARYAYQGIFLDLNPYFDRDQHLLELDDLPPIAFEAARIGTRLPGFPGASPGFGVAYNATLFAEAGLATPPTDWDDPSWNWDTMVDYAKKLVRTSGQDEVTRWGVDFWDGDALVGFAWAFGGDWFNEASYENGLVDQVTLNTNANEAAYQAVADLRFSHGVRPGGRSGPGAGIASFWQGDIAMWIDETGGNINPVHNPHVVNYEWGFAPFPYADGVERSRSFSWGGPIAAIPAGSENPDGAWEFIKFISFHKDTSPRISYKLNGVSEWMDYGISGLDYNQMIEVLSGSLVRSVPNLRSTVVGATEVWEVFADEVVPALWGEVPVRQALESADSRAAAVIQSLKEGLDQ